MKIWLLLQMIQRNSISIWVDERVQCMQINSKTINKPVNFLKYMNKWTGAIIIYGGKHEDDKKYAL